MFRAILLIIRRLNCINATSGVVTILRGAYGAQVATTSAPYGHPWRVTTPDAVLIQFNLLVMSMLLLETCRGL
jgi:hypothetical protein